MGSETGGAFRIRRLRFQDVKAGGAIVSCERLDDDGRAGARIVLRIPSYVDGVGRPFHLGQTIHVRGRMETWRDPRTGSDRDQIVVTEWHEVRPRGAAWIDFVAGSPAFPGMGRATAERIWNQLGQEIHRLLDQRDAARISRAIAGVSLEQARALVIGWAECGQDRLVQWLDKHGVPRRLCVALLKAYRDQDGAVESLDSDPYRLLAFGLSWDRIDEIARGSFHVAAEDPRRLHAAVVECLMREYRRGHTATPSSVLSRTVADILRVGAVDADAALRLVFSDGGFVRAGPDIFQLRGVHAMENAIAEDIARRCGSGRQAALDFGVDDMIDEHETGSASGMRLTREQRRAVQNGATLPFSIIVGGAGTGKTACLAALHHVVDNLNGRPGGVLQMALAGRAAKRMREATGRDAVTIAGFLHTLKEEGLAGVTHVVIDEASMLDVPGFHAVLRRLKGRASLVLVGDDFQLPPIGGGKILHLLAHRGDISVTVLDRVWRQEEGNSIRTVAASVRAGAAPDLPKYDGNADGVSLIVTGGDAVQTVRAVFEQLGGTARDSDVSVMTPRRRSGAGNALQINQAIHDAHFAGGTPVVSDGEGGLVDTGFCSGDRFVCDVNHWDVDLMNGSLGRIVRMLTPQEIESELEGRSDKAASAGRPIAMVDVDGEVRPLDDRHLLDCSWGYALTCHRAQGSDFSRIVVVLDDRVDRSWLYTAVTRGRRQVVLVGTPDQVDRICATAPRVDARRVGLVALLDRHMKSSMEGDVDRIAA